MNIFFFFLQLQSGKTTFLSRSSIPSIGSISGGEGLIPLQYSHRLCILVLQLEHAS